MMNDENEPINKKILISEYRNNEFFVSKRLVAHLSIANEVSFIFYSKDDIIKHINQFIGIPIIIGTDNEKYLKDVDILYFLNFANRNDIQYNEFVEFKELIKKLVNINKNIRVVLLSNIGVYGTNLDEKCFYFTDKKPNTKSGIFLSNVENYLISSGLKYSIIRTGTILTKEVRTEIEELIGKDTKQKQFLIPKQKNGINLVATQTLFSALLAAATPNNDKPDVIFNLSDTEKMSLKEFFELIYESIQKKGFKKERKYVNQLIIRIKLTLPKYLLYNHTLSTIDEEANGVVVVHTWTSELIIENLVIEGINKKIIGN